MHAARLAGSSYARFFTRELAMSLLPRKPGQWRRQRGTSSSHHTTTTSANNIRSKTTAPSAATALTNNKHDDHEEEAEKSSPVREHKKRRRSAAADEIDALFDDVTGGKLYVMRWTRPPRLRLRSRSPRQRPRREKDRAWVGWRYTLTSEPSWMR